MISKRTQAALKRLVPSLEPYLFSRQPLDELQINQRVYSIEHFVRNKVHCLEVGNYRFLTQNPEMKSPWGSKARQGDRIIWIISREDGHFLGRCLNGQVEIFGE